MQPILSSISNTPIEIINFHVVALSKVHASASALQICMHRIVPVGISYDRKLWPYLANRATSESCTVAYVTDECNGEFDRCRLFLRGIGRVGRLGLCERVHEGALAAAEHRVEAAAEGAGGHLHDRIPDLLRIPIADMKEYSGCIAWSCDHWRTGGGRWRAVRPGAAGSSRFAAIASARAHGHARTRGVWARVHARRAGTRACGRSLFVLQRTTCSTFSA